MSTLQKLNLKKILATTLVFVMIAYYYLYVVSPQLTAWLPLVLIIGIVLSGIILVDFAITNKLTRWYCKYLLFYIAVLGSFSHFSMAKCRLARTNFEHAFDPQER